MRSRFLSRKKDGRKLDAGANIASGRVVQGLFPQGALHKSSIGRALSNDVRHPFCAEKRKKGSLLNGNGEEMMSFQNLPA